MLAAGSAPQCNQPVSHRQRFRLLRGLLLLLYVFRLATRAFCWQVVSGMRLDWLDSQT